MFDESFSLGNKFPTEETVLSFRYLHSRCSNYIPLLQHCYTVSTHPHLVHIPLEKRKFKSAFSNLFSSSINPNYRFQTPPLQVIDILIICIAFFLIFWPSKLLSANVSTFASIVPCIAWSVVEETLSAMKRPPLISEKWMMKCNSMTTVQNCEIKLARTHANCLRWWRRTISLVVKNHYWDLNANILVTFHE